MALDRPYLRFHVDELRFDGKDWQVAFTPRIVGWGEKQVRPVPDAEMQKIWKGYAMNTVLDEDSVKRYWRQIEGSVKAFLLREYWGPDAKK